ncbi:MULTISPECIES: glycosyltransferase [Synechococcales]|uniref:glycosyltransferase n=1 Tax=Synechococcus sp. CS-1333 TaxID=2848638 RepID=UPI00223BEBCB|nr:glycosyltransferase [Synechococcus sp. CS-1333]MCT0210006.1 glycosyltransferase [Synechococcus sp. CS-1333]
MVSTYNESANVEGCLRALLASDPPCHHWQLVVADDDSSNDTVSKAEGVIAANRLASIWKSTTGRGWTWRGRSLA